MTAPLEPLDPEVLYDVVNDLSELTEMEEIEWTDVTEGCAPEQSSSKGYSYGVRSVYRGEDSESLGFVRMEHDG